MKFLDDQKLVEFDELNHIYKYNNQELLSITNWISSFSDGFDKDGSILARKAIELGISQKKLKKQWSDKGIRTSKLGTFFHKSVEYYFTTGKIKKDKFKDIVTDFAQVYKFEGSVFSECRIFSPSLKLCGTSDLVNLIGDTINIMDFKCTEKPINDFAFGRKFNYPIKHLNDSKLNKYTLQLSAYAYILNLEYGLKIGNNHCLFRVDPKKRTIERISIELKLNEITEMIAFHTYKNSLSPEELENLNKPKIIQSVQEGTAQNDDSVWID